MDPQHSTIASLSLDLDDKWTYMKTRGDPRWSEFPSYLNLVVPRILSFLEKRSLTITVFVVGQDAAFPRNADLLRSIAVAGHEIANHSFHHEPWLHLYCKDEIELEITRAEECIQRATGRTPRGFRGPGYSVSGSVFDILVSRGYVYDASTLPTFLGPIARAWYLMTANLNSSEKRRRVRLFGRWRDGFRSLKPYQWHTPLGKITEIPVTTMPVFRVPFHLSYLCYLLSYSRSLAENYMNVALALCRASKIAPSFLLHPLDFLGPADAPELAFFPAMQLPVEQKLEMADFAIRKIAAEHRITTIGEHAAAISRAS